MHIASFHGDYNLIQYYLKLGGNPSLTDNKGN